MSEVPRTASERADFLLQRARAAFDSGAVAQAYAQYAELYRTSPRGIPEASAFLAFAASGQGRTAEALRLLSECGDRDERPIRIYYALTCEALGKLDEAEAQLRALLLSAQDDPEANLHLGTVLEQKNDLKSAARHYFRAMLHAQRRGLWRDAGSSPLHLQPKLRRAMSFLAAYRPRVAAESLQPLYARFGRESMTRIEGFVRQYVDDVLPQYADSRQRPKSYYLPGLPTRPYFGRSEFSWVEPLEAAYAAICQEYCEIARSDDAQQPFLQLSDAARPEDYVHGPRGTQDWSAFFFFRHGRPYEKNIARCPATWEAVQALPLVRVPGNAPEVLYSTLAPGTHIVSHYGTTNTRLVVHLPLLIPDQCALKVGGELHVWQAGRCVIFDDTFEHEAWNRSEENRAVLIADVWNPYLTDAEQEAMTMLVPALLEAEGALS